MPDTGGVPSTHVVPGAAGGWTAVIGEVSAGEAQRLADRRRVDLDDGPAGVAIVRWEPSIPRLLLCRAPGPSPSLHLRADGDRVAWAVRLADLVQPGDRVDRNSAAAFLAVGRITVGRALVEGIERVCPGDVVAVDRRGVERRWVVLDDWPEEAEGEPRDRRLDRLRLALDAAVDRVVGRSDRSVLGLSGGIDSTLLAVVMAAHLGLRPTAFTVRFPGYRGPMDEFEAAAATAEALGIPHEPLVLRPEFVVDHLAWMVEWFDGPFVHALHTADLAVGAGADVLVSGAGGDAWSLLRNQRHGLALGRLPRAVLGPIRGLAERLATTGLRGSARFAKVAVYGADLTDALARAGARMPDRMVAAMLGDDAAAEARRLLREHYAVRLARLEGLSPAMALKYLRGHVSAADKDTDWTLRWAGAYGLRPAMPYMDPALTRVLAPMVVEPGDRLELRELAAEHLPRSAAFRAKVGQTVPLAAWFRGPLRELVEDTLSPAALAADGLLDPAPVRQLVAEHMSGAADHHWDLLATLTLVMWKCRVVDPAPPDRTGG